jgi:hypothetical protein
MRKMPVTGRIEIVPVGEDMFVERNGPVRLNIERGLATGDVISG